MINHCQSFKTSKHLFLLCYSDLFHLQVTNRTSTQISLRKKESVDSQGEFPGLAGSKALKNVPGLSSCSGFPLYSLQASLAPSFWKYSLWQSQQHQKLHSMERRRFRALPFQEDPSSCHCVYMDEIPPLVLQKSGSLLVERGGSQLGLSGPQSPCGVRIVVAQSLSQIRLFATPWTAARQPSLSFTISQSLLKLMFIESVMPSNYLILFCPLLLLPSIFPSSRVFSNESALCIRWPKYWSFSFSISPSNEDSGLISFRVDWLDLLAA